MIDAGELAALLAGARWRTDVHATAAAVRESAARIGGQLPGEPASDLQARVLHLVDEWEWARAAVKRRRPDTWVDALVREYSALVLMLETARDQARDPAAGSARVLKASRPRGGRAVDVRGQ
jgi:hypothetical protein